MSARPLQPARPELDSHHRSSLAAKRLLVAVLFVVVALAASSIVAQSLAFESGSILVHVVDQDGVPLPEARVRLTFYQDSQENGSQDGAVSDSRRVREAVTDSRGRCAFLQLGRGAYSLEVSIDDHVSSWVEDIFVEIGETLSYPFRLAPGRSTSVTVTSMPVIDTATATGRVSLGRLSLEGLPSGGSIGALLALRPRPSEPTLFAAGGRVARSPSALSPLPVAFFDATVAAPLDNSAELGQAIAPPLDLVARSGGSKWRASVELYGGLGQPERATSSRSATSAPRSAGSTSPAQTNAETGGTRSARAILVAGGPIAKSLRVFAGAAAFESRSDRNRDRGDDGLGLGGDRRGRDRDDFLQLRLDAQPIRELDLTLLLIRMGSSRDSPLLGSEPLRFELRELATSLAPSESRPALDLAGLTVSSQLTPRLAIAARAASVGEESRGENRRPFLAGDPRPWSVRKGIIAARGAWIHGLALTEIGGSTTRNEGQIDGGIDYGIVAPGPGPGEGERFGGPRRMAPEPEPRSVWAQQRVRWRSVSVRYGVRGERFSLPGARSVQEWSPRFALAWDPTGAGQWSLFASAGDAASITGVEPRSATAGLPSDHAAQARRSVERSAAAGLRHQVLPGLVVDAEVVQRRWLTDDSRGQPWPWLSTCPGTRRSARLGALVAPLPRFSARLDYDREYADGVEGCQVLLAPSRWLPWLGLDFPQSVLFPSHGIRASSVLREPAPEGLDRLRATWLLRLDGGFDAAAVVRYEGGIRSRFELEEGPAGVVLSRHKGSDEFSLAQIDVALGYRFRAARSPAARGLEIGFRAEVLNLFDRRTPLILGPSLESESGASRPGPVLLYQAPRQVWLGLRLAY